MSRRERLRRLARAGARTVLRRIQAPPYNTTAFAAGYRPGPLTELFSVVRTIPGWFNIDDCAHFHLILEMQRAAGLVGDLFEIGTYHGRSTCIMARCLAAEERLVVCDAFEGETGDRYADRPSPERLRANLRRAGVQLAPEQLEIHVCLSGDLELPPGPRFRFAHVDGGHSYAEAGADLALCAERMITGGVIAVDDYAHRDWPEVTRAVDDFLRDNADYQVLADLNRHGAIGRKIYLRRR